MQNYFPSTYQPYNFPQQYQTQQYQPQQYQSQQVYQQPQTSSGINWIDGLSAAKAYPIVNGTSVLLMDSNENAFYIKSADQSGMPSIKIFDYTERTSHEPKNENIQDSSEPQLDMSNYVTKEELNKTKIEFDKKLETLSTNNNYSSSKNQNRK